MEFLLVLLLILSIVDIVTTEKVLDLGGSEASPTVQKIMKWFGGKWWLPKLVITILAILFIGVGASAYPTLAFIVAAISDAGMSWVIWNNLKVIKKLKSK